MTTVRTRRARPTKAGPYEDVRRAFGTVTAGGTRRGRTMLAMAGLVALAATVVIGQQRGGTARTDAITPVNDGPNPYTVIRDWAQLTMEMRPWGGSNGVDIDRDGRTVWATDRCSPGTAPGCVGSTGNPVHHFDEGGREIKSFGAGMFVWPHGIHVDRDGNIWVTDAALPRAEDLARWPNETRKGSVVVKFSPDGRVLMTIGTAGVRGDPPTALTDPTDVVTDPANGDVYIAESHTDVTTTGLIGRISVFDRSGRFLRTLGKAGTGPGEFRTPHAIEFDSQGRLVVADRHNHRIQVITKTGTPVTELDAFGRVSGLAIGRGDVLYTTDSESTERVHPGWRKGIRIGSLADGKVTIFVPPHVTPAFPDGVMGEGIAIDAAGNVFTAETQVRGVVKYVRK
jgi:DNA-binding beta-propeller fold protein YncE